MEKKATLHTSGTASNGMNDLLLTPLVTKQIATSYDSYELILFQVQRDLTGTSMPAEEQLAVLTALRLLDSTLKRFREEGNQDLKDN